MSETSRSEPLSVMQVSKFANRARVGAFCGWSPTQPRSSVALHPNLLALLARRCLCWRVCQSRLCLAFRRNASVNVGRAFPGAGIYQAPLRESRAFIPKKRWVNLLAGPARGRTTSCICVGLARCRFLDSGWLQLFECFPRSARAIDWSNPIGP